MGKPQQAGSGCCVSTWGRLQPAQGELTWGPASAGPGPPERRPLHVFAGVHGEAFHCRYRNPDGGCGGADSAAPLDLARGSPERSRRAVATRPTGADTARPILLRAACYGEQAVVGKDPVRATGDG